MEKPLKKFNLANRKIVIRKIKKSMKIEKMEMRALGHLMILNIYVLRMKTQIMKAKL